MDDAQQIYRCSGLAGHPWPDQADAAKCCNPLYTRARRIVWRSDAARIEFYWQPVDRLDPAAALRLLGGAAGRTGFGHVAFFERLAEITNEQSAGWRSVCAGLLTLRMVDRFAAAIADDVAQPPRFADFHTAHAAVSEVASDALRDVLTQLLTGAMGSPDGQARSVPGLLFGYAWLLEDTGEWSLAADVYETVIAFADRLTEPETAVWGYHRLGACLRQLGRTLDAGSAWGKGLALARRLGETDAALRIRISEANLALHRGDLPAAETLLDRVILAARRGDDHRESLAMALHDRGLVARERGDASTAAQLLREALEQYPSPGGRERALADLACAMADLGWRSIARDAFLVLHRAAASQHVRWSAASNLLEMAAEDGDADGFERYRRALDGQAMPARMHAQALLRVAEGYDRLGVAAMAEASYRVLHDFATQHGLNEFVIRAEDGAKGIGPAPVRSAVVPIPEDYVPLAATLRDQRLTLARAEP